MCRIGIRESRNVSSTDVGIYVSGEIRTCVHKSAADSGERYPKMRKEKRAETKKEMSKCVSRAIRLTAVPGRKPLFTTQNTNNIRINDSHR